jgi:hypothetical protein
MQLTAPDYIQLGGAVFNGLTMLATAVSVFFAIHVYRRNRSKEEFSAFRQSLLNLRHGISELDSLLSEPPFTQLGFNIAKHIRRIFSSVTDSNQLVQILTDNEKHDLVAQAIHLGRLETHVIANVEKQVFALSKLLFTFRDQFPVVFATVLSLLTYIQRIGAFGTSPKLLDQALSEIKHNVEAGRLLRFSDMEENWAQLGNFFAGAPSQLASTQQPVFNNAEKLIGIIIERFTTMTDSELARESKAEKKHAGAIAKINTPTHVEDAFEFFKLRRELFDTTTWDVIAMETAKLQERTMGKSE